MISAFVACAGSGAVQRGQEPGQELEDKLRARLRLLCTAPDQESRLIRVGSSLVGVLQHPLPALGRDWASRVYCGDAQATVLVGRTAPNVEPDRLPATATHSLDRLVGAFILVHAESGPDRLTIIRDHLGDRSAYYRNVDGVWWLSSHEQALMEPAEPVNSRRLAQFFAIDYPAADSTFFADIGEVPPGHSLTVGPDPVPRVTPYYRLPRRTSRLNVPASEAAEELQRLLRLAVRQSCDGTSPAVAVSGGMDSTSVAACISGPAQLLTYRTPGYPGCDESNLAKAVATTLGHPLTLVDCSACGPLSEDFLAQAPLVQDPGADAYRAFRRQLAEAGKAGGHRLLLTGDFGDQLFGGFRYWLRDLLYSRRWHRGMLEATRLWRSSGVMLPWRQPELRRLLPLAGFTRGWKPVPRPWLTERAADLLPPQSRHHPYLGELAQADRVEPCLNAFNARAASLGYLQALDWGVELRYPLRHRQLVEFMLRLPAHYLYQPGRSKWILRLAMADQLPAQILDRRDKTSLEPIFRDAVLHRHRQTTRELLRESETWSRFVRRQWLLQRLDSGQWDPTSLNVLWNCLTFALWNANYGKSVVSLN